MSIFYLFTDFHYWLYGALLSSARFFPVFILLPYLSQASVPVLFRFPLVFILGGLLWPCSIEFIATMDVMEFTGILMKELVIGLIIALFLCFPFWTLHAVGSYIDNQRGATISSSISPQTGVDSSELANFLNLFSVVIILQAEGISTFLEMMQRSYQLWPPETWLFPPVSDILRFIAEMMANAVRIASPVITMFLVTEFMLGLLARYTPQLNAFSLAMTLKSLVGFVIFNIYLSPVIPTEIINLERMFLYGY